MNHEQCQAYLEAILASGVKFGLDNVRTVLSSFGCPQDSFPSILVAGTNGKGSVSAMVARIISLHGLRVGLYTSPHLVRVEERFRVGQEPISSRELCLLLSRLKRRVETLIKEGNLAAPPTYFETLTCLAFLFFEARRVDIAVLEVGMGGRLDATNVVTPLVSVITTVGLDHGEFLGSTLEEIAFEKAGIIKPGIPVICGQRSGAARRVIRRRTKQLKAPFREVFDEKNTFRILRKRKSLRFSFRWQGRTYLYSPSLRGEHQGRNAAVAIATAVELSRLWRPLAKEKIVRGIEEARWEGRLEVVSKRPLVVLDGAHNPQGAKAAAVYGRDFLPRPLTLVFGAMKDKDIRAIAGSLFPLAQRVVLTTIPCPRAASAELIFSLVPRWQRRTMLVPSPKEAFLKAKELTPASGSVLVTGSLFLVGEVKKLLSSPRPSLLF